MTEAWIFQAIAIGVHQVKNAGSNMGFRAEYSVWWKDMTAGVDRVRIKPGTLAAGLGSIRQGARGKVQRGTQAFLQFCEGHAWLQVIELHLVLDFSRHLVLFSRPLHDACNLLFSLWFWQLWEKEDTNLRAQQRHIAQQFFDGAMRIGGVAAAEIVLGVQHDRRFTPDQLTALAYFQGLLSLNGVVGTRGWSIFPIRLIPAGGIPLPVL